MNREEKNAYMRNYYHTTKCVVYAYIDKNTDEIVYIGSTRKLEERDYEHLTGKTSYFDQHYNNKEDYMLIILYEGKTSKEVKAVELEEIKKYKPKYNITGIKNKEITEDYIQKPNTVKYLRKEEVASLLSSFDMVSNYVNNHSDECSKELIKNFGLQLKDYMFYLYPSLNFRVPEDIELTVCSNPLQNI